MEYAFATTAAATAAVDTTAIFRCGRDRSEVKIQQKSLMVALFLFWSPFVHTLLASFHFVFYEENKMCYVNTLNSHRDCFTLFIRSCWWQTGAPVCVCDGVGEKQPFWWTHKINLASIFLPFLTQTTIYASLEYIIWHKQTQWIFV